MTHNEMVRAVIELSRNSPMCGGGRCCPGSLPCYCFCHLSFRERIIVRLSVFRWKLRGKP